MTSPSQDLDLDHHLGLAHDLRAFDARRRTLRWLVGGGVAGLSTLPLWGCGGGSDDGSATTTGTTSGTTLGSCSVIPEETAGPYPGDGSNTGAQGSIANALAVSGIVRRDIRSSVGGATGTAEGVPLSVVLNLVNTGAACADLAGYAIYLWHCDREGRYSMYSAGVADQNYLRGVQETDSAGQASFNTVFPGCYSGRMPHIHFEIYRSLATATASPSKLRTSQIAFPTEVCQTVYASSGYSASVANLARISFASDNVFSDGVTLQMASIAGSLADGLTAELTVGIAA